MKNKKIFNAVGKISDELIEDAAISKKNRKTYFPWKTLIASAACFCLLLTALISMPHLLRDTPDVTSPATTNPSSPTSQGNNDKYVPFLSAYDVAGVLTSFADRDETNSYTVEAYPKDYLAKVLNIPEGNSINLYNYLTTGEEPNQESLQSFSEKVYITLENALGISIPVGEFEKNDDYAGSFYYSSFTKTEDYVIRAEENNLMDRVLVLPTGANGIVFNGTTVRIDPLMADGDILEQFAPTAQIINTAFGTSFKDIAVIKSYHETTANGINRISIFLYNRESEPNVTIGEIPLSDYIHIEFSHCQNDDGKGIKAGLVSYVQYRVPVEDRLIQVREEPILTLEQAEEMLKKGYVFGGHSCSLCMQNQEKVDFSEYDYVGFEYVMNIDSSESARLCVPFYAFYKRLEPAPNGNETYAKTYVCAVPMTDIDTYFEIQTANHS